MSVVMKLNIIFAEKGSALDSHHLCVIFYDDDFFLSTSQSISIMAKSMFFIKKVRFIKPVQIKPVQSELPLMKVKLM